MASQIIDMKLMRYINLFEKVSKVSTTKCFIYNNVIIFAVPKSKIFKAIGKSGENVKKIGGILTKKIKVISMPKQGEQIDKFVKETVSPVTFNKIEVRENSVTITAGRQSKAALIGRSRVREKELGDVLKKFFGIGKLKIT